MRALAAARRNAPLRLGPNPRRSHARRRYCNHSCPLRRCHCSFRHHRAMCSCRILMWTQKVLYPAHSGSRSQSRAWRRWSRCRSQSRLSDQQPLPSRQRDCGFRSNLLVHRTCPQHLGVADCMKDLPYCSRPMHPCRVKESIPFFPNISAPASRASTRSFSPIGHFRPLTRQLWHILTFYIQV